MLPTPVETDFLRACVHEGECGRNAWTRWQNQAGDWTARLASEPADRTVLLPLLYRTLKRNAVRLSIDETTFLREAYLIRAVETRTYLHVCDEVLRTLSDAHLSCLVVKGAALGRTVYPDPALRPAGDIDLLLRESDLGPAADALRAAGWRWKEPPIDFGRHHLSPLEHQSGLTVELHRRLFSAYYELPVEALFDRSRTCTLGDVPSLTLSPEDTLVHVCGHAARCRTRTSLRWVADALFVVQTHKIDWDMFLDTTCRGRLALPLAIMITYLAEDIEAPVPPFVLHRLWDEASRTDVMGREAARLAAGAKPRLRLQDVVAAPERWPATIARVRERMFPPASEIRLSHGVDDRHASGYQAYRVWCFILRNLRRQ